MSADFDTALEVKRLSTVRARLALQGYQIRPCNVHGSWWVFGIARARHCAEVADVEAFADELEHASQVQKALA